MFIHHESNEKKVESDSEEFFGACVAKKHKITHEVQDPRYLLESESQNSQADERDLIKDLIKENVAQKAKIADLQAEIVDLRAQQVDMQAQMTIMKNSAYLQSKFI